MVIEEEMTTLATLKSTGWGPSFQQSHQCIVISAHTIVRNLSNAIASRWKVDTVQRTQSIKWTARHGMKFVGRAVSTDTTVTGIPNVPVRKSVMAKLKM